MPLDNFSNKETEHLFKLYVCSLEMGTRQSYENIQKVNILQINANFIGINKYAN